MASGRARVEMGLTAPRTTSGSPLVTPPVNPPALLVRWTQRPASSRPSMTSWTCEPNRRVCSNPRPNSTPLTMLMLMTAAARAASRRRSQWTYDPSPIGSPCTTTSKTPPTVSPADRASSIRAIIAASASGSGQRSGETSASSRVRVAFAGSRATPPTSAVNDQTSIPSSRRKARATAPAATRAAVSRAEARSSTLRTSLKPYLRAPARSAWPGRTRVTGVARLLPPSAALAELRGFLLGERPDLHDPRPVLPVAVADQQQDRRAERAAVADPAQDLRPVLLDRLTRAPPVALLAAGEVDRDHVLGQGRPAGTPSIVAPRAGPCDSPAVRKRNAVTRPRPPPVRSRRRPVRPRPSAGRRPVPRRAWPASGPAGQPDRSTA